MASSYNQTYSLWDLFRGRGNRQSPQDQRGFIFVEQSGQTNSGEKVDVDNLLDEATTMSCITAIVQGITQIPVRVRTKNDDGTYSIIENHRITKLLNRPNDYQTASEFKSSVVTGILTHGNAFIRVVRQGDVANTAGQPLNPRVNKGGKVLQLYPLDPSDITIGSNAFGVPTYEHEEYGPVNPDSIIHIRDLTTFTPQGLSRPLLMAEIIGAKKAADKLMAETFKNGASIQYAVSSNAALDSTKLDAFQKQLQEVFGRGGSRRGGVALIENGNINKVEGIKPADLDLRELREMLIREIAAGFKVPEMLAGGSANQPYNNVRQQWTAFHRDTLQPIITNIEEAITLKLLSSNEYLHFDIQEILKGDVETTARIAQGNVSNGIWTPNDGRNYMGTPKSDDPEADKLIRPNSSTNTNITPEETPENATGGEDGPQGGQNVEQ